MTTVRRFCCNDLLRVAPLNFNSPLAEFNLTLNFNGLSHWPDLFQVADYPGGQLAGYSEFISRFVIGACEGQGDSRHGQVSRICTIWEDIDVAEALLEVFREYCDDGYKVYFLNIGVGISDTCSQDTLEDFGFRKYKTHPDILGEYKYNWAAEDSLREGSPNTNSFRRRDHEMTTYRRFCCNDLLRMGLIDLDADTSTHPTSSYLGLMAFWPENCIVADVPGGRITGYIFGKIEGVDEDTVGNLSVVRYSTLDTAKVMSGMLEAACDKLYHANGMKIIIEADCKEAISECLKLGYTRYKSDSKTVEMHKKFRLILTRATENLNEVAESTSYDRD